MPTYEYRCTACGCEQTKERPIARRHELVRCECGGDCVMRPSITASRPDMTVATLTWPNGYKSQA